MWRAWHVRHDSILDVTCLDTIQYSKGDSLNSLQIRFIRLYPPIILLQSATCGLERDFSTYRLPRKKKRKIFSLSFFLATVFDLLTQTWSFSLYCFSNTNVLVFSVCFTETGDRDLHCQEYRFSTRKTPSHPKLFSTRQKPWCQEKSLTSSLTRRILFSELRGKTSTILLRQDTFLCFLSYTLSLTHWQCCQWSWRYL